MFLSVSLLLAVWIGVAEADPEESLAFRPFDYSNYDTVFSVSDGYSLAQSFIFILEQSQNETVEKIGFGICTRDGNQPPPGLIYSVSICDDSGYNTPGDVLASADIAIPDSLPSFPDLERYIVPLSVGLSGGNTYWVVWEVPSTDMGTTSDFRLFIASASSGTYPDGIGLSTYNGGPWFPQMGSEFFFGLKFV